MWRIMADDGNGGKGGNEETVFDATVVVVIDISALLIYSVGGILRGLGDAKFEGGC